MSFAWATQCVVTNIMLSWSLNVEMERDALGIGRNLPNMDILVKAKHTFILQ